MQAVLPIYLLVAVGMVLRKTGVVTHEMEKGMLKLVIHCLYPCLILDKTLGNELVRQGSGDWIGFWADRNGDDCFVDYWEWGGA